MADVEIITTVITDLQKVVFPELEPDELERLRNRSKKPQFKMSDINVQNLPSKLIDSLPYYLQWEELSGYVVRVVRTSGIVDDDVPPKQLFNHVVRANRRALMAAIDMLTMYHDFIVLVRDRQHDLLTTWRYRQETEETLDEPEVNERLLPILDEVIADATGENVSETLAAKMVLNGIAITGRTPS